MIRLILLVPLLPFIAYAAKDQRYHLRTRKPGLPENLTHLMLGLFQGGMVLNAFRLDLMRVAAATVGIAFFGAVDEFGFHRNLPPAESDLHAKAHIALFALVAVAVALCVGSASG